MRNIRLILQREYLSRVKKRSFIIMTLLGPILICALIFLPSYFMSTNQLVEQKQIWVLDESKYFDSIFLSDDLIEYQTLQLSFEEAKRQFQDSDIYGFLYIPVLDIQSPDGYVFYTKKNASLTIKNIIERKLDSRIEALRLQNLGLSWDQVKAFEYNTQLKSINLSNTGQEQISSSTTSTALGYAGSFLIYMFIFLYGSMCLRAVIEEKNSRIVEIVISSVRPFHLMIGKIIGISFVALTQLIFWVALSFFIFTGVAILVGTQAGSEVINNMNQMSANTNAVIAETAKNAIDSFAAINIGVLIYAFIFYFIGGYFLYGSFFAAVGSACDTDQESQQFMLPITIPLIFSIIMIGVVLKDPNSSFSIWLSMIPFTSPVIMMVRVAFGVDFWQLLLSQAFLIIGFIGSVWIASRIYRVGILMHGTKVNWRVLAKWFFTH